MPRDVTARLSPALAVSETGFVFDPRTGHSFTVNPTGLFALRALQAGRPLSEVVTQLAQEYPEAPSLEEDLQGFVRQLATFGLTVAGVEGDSP
jgi:hypothetical protein